MILIQSNSDSSTNEDSYGGFTGSLQYDYLGDNEGLLTITLTNTSEFNGKIVALAFDGAEGTDGWVFDTGQSSGLSGSWGDISGEINTAPFGFRSSGSSISNSWTGGGNPNGGLHVGETGVWTFTSSDASSSTTAEDFFSPNYPYNLLVRFRGFDNGASDKLAAMPEDPPPAVPGFAGLPLIALAGGVIRRRRRR